MPLGYESKSNLIMSEELQLERAGYEEFASYFAVYRDNIRFRKDWSVPMTSLPKDSPCYWIVRRSDGNRIGGVLLRPNWLGPLFFIPPYGANPEFIADLKSLLLRISDPEEEVSASGVLQGQYELLKQAGFTEVESRRSMVRPTDRLGYSFPEGYLELEPAPGHAEALARLCLEVYGGSGTGEIREDTFEDHLDSMKDCYETVRSLQGGKVLLKASTVLLDGNGDPAALCLISSNEGWPYVENIAVSPGHQGTGLGRLMLRKALTELAGIHPLLMLFVTLGNPAEKLYYSLGFKPGPAVSRMRLERRDMP